MALATNYVGKGYVVDYTNPSSTVTIAAGTPIVQGKLFGVTVDPILPGRIGGLGTRGVWDLPKATSAGSAITVGSLVYWDATNNVVTTTATNNTEIGKTIKAAADADALVRVHVRP